MSFITMVLFVLFIVFFAGLFTAAAIESLPDGELKDFLRSLY